LQLYLAFGVLTAAGVSTAGGTPAAMLVQRQLSQRLGLALGITGSGIGLGIFLVVPICRAMIDATGSYAMPFTLAAATAGGPAVAVTLSRRHPLPGRP
jgi:hypothetical protein